MKQYLSLLEDVLKNGQPKEDRTGVGTLAVFGRSIRFDMSCGLFPLLTTKRMHFKGILVEALWHLRGDTNTQFLHDNGVTIWDEWADKNGDLGPIYGHQWRNFNGKTAYGSNGFFTIAGKDQLIELITELRHNPNSRRHLVTAWNPLQLDEMKLPPCHFAWQCQVMDGKLNIHVFMRSLDVFLGLPYDMGLYGVIMTVLCNLCNLQMGELLITATDVHLYRNHLEQAKLQLTREPFMQPIVLPKGEMTSIDNLTVDMFQLEGYASHPPIKAPVAV